LKNLYSLRSKNLSLAAAIMTVIATRPVSADGVDSLTPKKSVPFRQSICTLPEFSVLTLGDILSLVHKANSGNPLAQHELGLRYLTGNQFPPDTAKAAYWIGKAADRSLISAHYNMGIMLDNGWGVAWNPFKAYRHFQYAALHGMVEARYVYALILTENLVVPRNDRDAYRWLVMAADSGFAPAKEMLAEFQKRMVEGGNSPPDDGETSAGAKKPSDPAAATDPGDAAPRSQGNAAGLDEDAELMKDALDAIRSGAPDHAGDGGSGEAERMYRSVCTAAEAGSPEALTLMGRWAETGRVTEPDEAAASMYYLRAMRNQSVRAPVLMLGLTQREGYFERLKAKIAADDAAARFIWAKLAASGLDRQLSQVQILDLFKKAAAGGCTEALVELGLSYYSGRGAAPDREKAMSFFQSAAHAGHREAQIRLWMMDLGEKEDTPPSSLVDSLKKASGDGSILAETMLGYCYRNGTGTARNLPRAVYNYRRAAFRGSHAAFAALRDMFDAIRPEDPEFQIGE
jgi:TPR repeat protein